MSTDNPPNGFLKFCKISFIVGCILSVFMLVLMQSFMFSLLIAVPSCLLLLVGKGRYQAWEQFYKEMQKYEENADKTGGDKEQNPATDIRQGIPSLVFLLLIGVSAIFIIGGLLSDAGFVSVIGVILLGLGAFIFKMQKIEKKAAEEERETEIAQAEADHKSKVLAFYEECRAANAVDLSIDVKRQKATLIAETYFTNCDLDSTMAEGERLHNAHQEAKRLAAEKDEKAAQEELLKYANCHGREKLLTMIDDEYRLYRQDLVEMVNRYNTIATGSAKIMIKEKSWGLAGGIAEALAGPAAGVAAAIDVQRQNAAARDFNERWTAMSAKSLSYLQSEIKRLEGTVDYYIESYRKARTLMVKDDCKQECFDQLTFGTPEIKISNTGTATINVSVSANEYTIFDEYSADIDGSVIAHIYDTETEVGQAIMVFPRGGSGYGSCTLTGMALSCCKPGTQYRIEFSPNDLWAIEKLYMARFK